MTFFENSKIEEVTLQNLMDHINNETIKLPLFQRSLVWKEGRNIALWDSILRKFPLPLFFVYKGNKVSRNFQTSSKPGHGATIEKPNDCYDLLDGQQRVVAIESVLNYNSDSTNRIWVDLAPPNKPHPFDFKFWLHNCSKVFPFGFSLTASGEHDFSPLTDHEIQKIWQRMQTVENMKNKEFYQISLGDTFPWKARCPVPLDELINNNTDSAESIMDSIKRSRYRVAEKENVFKEERPVSEHNEKDVRELAKVLKDLRDYTLTFQLVDIREPEDAMIYVQRLGRGGIQISTRQLAVSRILQLLGKEGNDAVASFQESPKLKHLLDTEDVIHAASRIAVVNSISKTKKNIDTDNDKLIDLSLETLSTIRRNAEIWPNVLQELKNLCCKGTSNVSSKSRIQEVFETLYSSLRFDEKHNEKGFSLVQLAQSDRRQGGIAPITLHPLVFWIMKNNSSAVIDPKHRDDMLRWLLFSNGFVEEPTNKKLNMHILNLVMEKSSIDFADVIERTKELLNNDVKTYKKLGLQFQIPGKNGELKPNDKAFPDFFNLEFSSEITLRRLIFQNWPKSMMNNVFLMWNQRTFLEELYGKITYIPALFSKGRPFDADHIVSRNRLINRHGKVITQKLVTAGVNSVIEQLTNVSDLKNEQAFVFTQDCFRKYFTNMTANYRYWPRILNRSDGDEVVKQKFTFEFVKDKLKNHPLNDKFTNQQVLWGWSQIPEKDIELWNQLPPEEPWDENTIGNFFLAVVKRDRFLYKNVHDFVFNQE
jgi:hypothetical protein